MTRRNWDAAREKVDEEGVCRNCGTPDSLQAAHIVPRSRISAGGGAEDPRNILPLCAQCHAFQHTGYLELLPLMDLDEQAYVVSLVGIVEALRRTTKWRGVPDAV